MRFPKLIAGLVLLMVAVGVSAHEENSDGSHLFGTWYFKYEGKWFTLELGEGEYALNTGETGTWTFDLTQGTHGNGILDFERDLPPLAEEESKEPHGFNAAVHYNHTTKKLSGVYLANRVGSCVTRLRMNRPVGGTDNC